MTREKIAIFGGTFDPVHNGHLHLLKAYMSEISFDKILVIPTKIPPHKGFTARVTNEQRLMMCRLAFEPMPSVVVSDMEYHLKGKSYSIHTIKKCKQMYPEADFYFIIGSDMLFTFDQWYQYKEILNEVTLLTAARNHDEYKNMEKKAKVLSLGANARIRLINRIPFPLSSTEIRYMIAKEENISHLVPKPVAQYIKKYRLYVTTI